MGTKQSNKTVDEDEEDFYFEDWETSSSRNKSNLVLNNNIIITKNINSNPFDDYVVIKDIGSGTYSKVQLVQHKINLSIRAMKVIKKKKKKGTNQTNEHDVYKEVNLLIKMDHPNIVKIFEFYNGEKEYYLIMEYCEGGELFDKIVKSNLTEIQCAYIMYQIISAVNYCHKMKIIHRDLKPENILIKKDEDGFYRVKVCDFGTSKAFKIGDTEKQLVGSAYYIAPEVIQKKYNLKCDLWSCGVIMFVLLTKKPPFGGRNDAIIMQNIQIGKYKEHLLDEYSPYAKELVALLLEKNIKKRINAEQALNHPWFDVFKCKDILTDIQDKDTIKRFIENLKNYKRGSIIQETALAFLVHNYPDLDEVVNACKLFGQIDKNGKGKITLNDFIEGLNKILKKNMEEDAKKIFENLDEYSSGYLEYEMFIRAAINKKIFLTEDTLKFTFKFFDKENTKKITSESILKIFEESIKKDENVKIELENMIKEASPNENLEMDFENFSEFMKSILN
jgi:calcium-dependent protein kinase